MTINRRNILIGSTALAAVTVRSAQCSAQDDRVTQEELDRAIQMHRIWLADMDSGQRCVFAGRNLSRLQFRSKESGPINLSGADFTQADLSETAADVILFHHCSFNGAKLNGSRWLHPVLASADMRRITAQRVEWGVPCCRNSPLRVTADFSDAIMKNADLAEAQICGYFYSTRLGQASLVQADLSFSDFIGPKYNFEMSFSEAQLTGAKLRHCQISSASFYHSDCRGTDFSDTVFRNVTMKQCKLNGANFDRAEVEGRMFSPEQMRQADLSQISIGKG